MIDVPEQELIEEGALPPNDFHNAIERICEVAGFDIEIPDDLPSRMVREANGLLVSEDLLSAATAALSIGHVVLQGPPGTGKSSLARALCRAYRCSVLPVTAHEDWTTYEVVGRQELRLDDSGHEQVAPVNGFFTEAVIQCAGAIVRHADDPSELQAVWLLIDELNRAHLDKAFGELFTVLGTDEPIPITLPHQRAGNRELVTPARFRIIATLNSVDKQFVNSLSQGIKRRFSFITVDVPEKRRPGEQFGSDAPDASLASREFFAVIGRATERIARRLAAGTSSDAASIQQDLRNMATGIAKGHLLSLFELVESVRYADKDAKVPYLPVGTAQIIDTVELFLSRVRSEGGLDSRLGELLDWAVSVKLAPLFDSDTIGETALEDFAAALKAPFDVQLRRALLQIVASGTYYAE